MAIATFDTLKFAKTLRAAGVPTEQAEAQATAFSEVFQANYKDLVTKDDLKVFRDEIKTEIKVFRDEIKTEFQHQEQQLDNKLRVMDQQLDNKLREMEQRLNAKIDTNEAKLRGEFVLMRWMIGVVGFGIVTILIRLFMIRMPI